MTQLQPLISWLQRAREDWTVLSQIAVLILGIVGAFLLPPPIGITERDDRMWLRLAQFTIAVSAGFVLVAARKWKLKKYASVWWGISILFFALSITLFFEYQNLSYKSTCTYSGAVLVIGSNYTPKAERYVAKNPGIGCQQLLLDSAGGVDKVWTKSSVDRNRLYLAVTYIGCLPLFTICIVTLIQAVNAISPRKMA